MTATENTLQNKTVRSDLNIKVNGTELTSDEHANVVSVVVEQSINLPSMFVMRLMNNGLDNTDTFYNKFKIGTPIEIKVGADINSTVSLMKGEVTSVELEADMTRFGMFIVRGYNKLHKLQFGRVTKPFLDVSFSDIISQVATTAGLSAQSSDTPSTVYKYILQNNESNFDFLRRYCSNFGLEMFVDDTDTKLVVRKPSTEETVSLEYGKNLQRIWSRVTGSHQVSEVSVRGWDVKQVSAIVGTKTSSTVHNKVPATTDTTKYASNIKTASVYRTNVVDQTEAQTIAGSILDDLKSRAVAMEGLCLGDANIKPGKTIEIKTIAAASGNFNGKYYLTNVTHIYDSNGYYTRFETAGKSTGTLVELSSPLTKNQPAINGVVIGVVTNNKHPDTDGYGYVKVKFPWMQQNSGSDIESNWARVVSPMAGTSRGLFILPEVNDEVLVAFEHGDVNRPYVLGAVWNGSNQSPIKAEKAVGSDGKVNQRIFYTRVGHQFIFDDESGKESIKLIDKSGKNLITIDTANKTIIIDSDKDINIYAKNGTISMEAKDIKLKTTQSIAGEATQNIELKATQNIDFKATQNFSAKATGNFSAEATQNASIKGTTGFSAAGLTAELKGDTTVTVKGSAGATVDGGAMATIMGGVVNIN